MGQEPQRLRKELDKAEQEVRALRAKVAEVQSTNGDMQIRVDTSENATKALRTQLETLREETSKLKGEDGTLQKKLVDERSGRQDLDEKLKKIKELELPLLNSIP